MMDAPSPANSPSPGDHKARADRIRCLAIDMVTRARASHIGSALSAIDILACLYASVMRVDPSRPDDPARDRFILSKGHACVGVYATLAECGFIPMSLLETYGADFSPLMHHISHKVSGVEFSTGSLGHGLPFGVGKAKAAKLSGRSWRTFVLLGDGEMAEGSNWEAMMFAAHHRLDNLVAVVDYNNLQSLTTVDKTLGLEPLDRKAAAFGWSVIEVDGHDHAALVAALDSHTGTPTLIIARTIKGKGVSFMEDQVAWHYKSPTAAERDAAVAGLQPQSERA